MHSHNTGMSNLLWRHADIVQIYFSQDHLRRVMSHNMWYCSYSKNLAWMLEDVQINPSQYYLTTFCEIVKISLFLMKWIVGARCGSLCGAFFKTLNSKSQKVAQQCIVKQKAGTKHVHIVNPIGSDICWLPWSLCRQLVHGFGLTACCNNPNIQRITIEQAWQVRAFGHISLCWYHSNTLILLLSVSLQFECCSAQI